MTLVAFTGKLPFPALKYNSYAMPAQVIAQLFGFDQRVGSSEKSRTMFEQSFLPKSQDIKIAEMRLVE